MRRRQFIASATATVATASIAGCSGILGGDGGGSGPEDPVEAYLEAAVEGDEEGMREAIHPDAGEGLLMAGAFLSAADDISIESTEVVEESENEATVEVTAELEAQGESETSTSTYIVRKNEDGEWKVYSSA